jgi:mono/diheme cytochrome c family protein
MRIFLFALSVLLATLPSYGNSGQIAHGKYIVTSVGMCVECHGAKLTGEVLPFKPTVRMKWESRSANLMDIARKVPADKFVRFLETGVFADGTRADPPMPQFRMSHDDAQAVVAYVRSLAGAK